ncbi:MAG: hypothetical protein ACK5MJ_00165 [Alphaproteobacteria bacterium]
MTKLPFILILTLILSLAWAEEPLEETQDISPVPQMGSLEHGYNEYTKSCLGCHDMAMISRNELEELHFRQTDLPNKPLIDAQSQVKYQDLSLLYKQTSYNYDKLRQFLTSFPEHPTVNYRHNLNQEYLLKFIHWANKPYANKAKRLGYLSMGYLLLMLTIWGLWALKLHHRVIRRYDRYDIPTFPDDNSSDFTNASNDS